VVAVARNGIIGRDGALPWRLSSDLKLFRRMTMGKPLIMGRRTFQSLGKPLDGRDNLVITHAADLAVPGVEFFGSIGTAMVRARFLADGRNVNEIMIIGGAKIYAQTLSTADRIYWTQVEADVAGDTSFPSFNRAHWREVAREPIPQSAKDDFPATLITLDRVTVEIATKSP
jgi:dihydrofolate reductase